MQEYLTLVPGHGKRIRTGDPRGFNKGRSSKFREGSRIRQTPEEGRRTYRPKRCWNNNKDEDNSPKNLNDKNFTYVESNGVYMSFLTQSSWNFVNVVVTFTNRIGKGMNTLTPQVRGE